jgi:hypothetical protein
VWENAVRPAVGGYANMCSIVLSGADGTIGARVSPLRSRTTCAEDGPHAQAPQPPRPGDRAAGVPAVPRRATNFDAHAATVNGKWIITTVQRYEDIWGDLRDASEGAASRFGAKRLPGNWALAYLAFVYSKHADVRPWWQQAGHSIWRESGFKEGPSYPLVHRRFAELEQGELADALAAAAHKLIRRAVKVSGGQVGRYVHVDATEAETHARLEHVCPPGSPCRRSNGRQVSRVTAGESMNLVREERHARADEPEPEGDALYAKDIGDAEEVDHTREALRVRVGGCWYEVLDPTAGVRAYVRGKKVKKFWVGFYNHKAIDHYTGAPLAVHVTSASLQEHLAYPDLFDKVVAATGKAPVAVVADRGYSVGPVFRFNTERGVASVMPWRAYPAKLTRALEDCDTHDRHGVVRCKYCGSPTDFVAFTKTAGGDRGPRLEVECAGKTVEQCRTKRQTIACETNWRMLLPMWRTTPTYLALRHSHDRYERVHNHWRFRYRVASDDHALRPKRRGLDCQQLRANAALLLEWLILCWREGWLPRQRGAPDPFDPDRVMVDDGRKFADSLHELRRDLGLDGAYGTKAVLHGNGTLRPVPGRPAGKAKKVVDPAEPDDEVVIPASINLTADGIPPDSDYAKALADAPAAARDPDVPDGIDSSVDVGATFADHRATATVKRGDDRLPPERLID